MNHELHAIWEQAGNAVARTDAEAEVTSGYSVAGVVEGSEGQVRLAGRGVEGDGVRLRRKSHS